MGFNTCSVCGTCAKSLPLNQWDKSFFNHLVLQTLLPLERYQEPNAYYLIEYYFPKQQQNKLQTTS